MSPRDCVVIRVRDTGIGMDEAHRARLFEPFFTTKPVGRGTGLGLAMVYGFIKQSGGFIAVDSKVGAGTTCHLYLPHGQGPTETPPHAAPVASAQTSSHVNKTLLVVEDEEGLRQVMVFYLSNHGYKVHAAASPSAALELLQREQIALDLLVTDLVMPGGSGLDLAEEILRLYPQAGVLYVSGYALNDLAKRGLSQIPGVFLLKPFGLEQLAESVRQAMPAPRPPATPH